MPIYEYVCDSCGKQIEKIQKFSDPLLTECDCEQKGRLRKMMSQSSFVLKGGGWYMTDYANKSTNGAKTEVPNAGQCAMGACETGACSTDLVD